MSYRKSGYKDIDKWRKTVTKYNREYYRKTAIYDKRKWTQEEIDEIMKHEIPDIELSKKLQKFFFGGWKTKTYQGRCLLKIFWKESKWKEHLKEFGFRKRYGCLKT